MMMGSVAPSGGSALADLRNGWMWLLGKFESDQLVYAVDRFRERFAADPAVICMNQQTFDAMFDGDRQWSGFQLEVVSWVPDQHVWMPVSGGEHE